MDGLAPKFLSRLSKTGQPTIATWITGGIALAAVVLGELYTVAKFVTELFLTLYVIINLVAAIAKLVAEPSYRPKVNIAWYWSLARAFASLYVMYLISPIALIVLLGLEFACDAYFKNKAMEQQWGDVNAGIWMKVARFSLMRMNERQISARNWRPIILLFAENITRRIELVKLAAAFGQNRGIFTIPKLLFTRDEPSRMEKKKIKLQMLDEVNRQELEAFCKVNVVQSLNKGILNISKGHGIAGLKTNTIMFGWSEREQSNINQLTILRELSLIGKNIVLVKFNKPEVWLEQDHQRIDIWWSGRENNGDLMLILAYMLKLNNEWEHARIHIHAVVENEAEKEILSGDIKKSLTESRIPASVNVLISKNQHFSDVKKEQSSDGDIVFLGLKVTDTGNEEKR